MRVVVLGREGVGLEGVGIALLRSHPNRPPKSSFAAVPPLGFPHFLPIVFAFANRIRLAFSLLCRIPHNGALCAISQIDLALAIIAPTRSRMRVPARARMIPILYMNPTPPPTHTPFSPFWLDTASWLTCRVWVVGFIGSGFEAILAPRRPSSRGASFPWVAARPHRHPTAPWLASESLPCRLRLLSGR